jgi:hypothetical protein
MTAQLAALDPVPSHHDVVEERQVEPILSAQEIHLENAAKRLSAVRVCHRCQPYAGATLATICREHLAPLIEFCDCSN